MAKRTAILKKLIKLLRKDESIQTCDAFSNLLWDVTSEIRKAFELDDDHFEGVRITEHVHAGYGCYIKDLEPIKTVGDADADALIKDVLNCVIGGSVGPIDIKEQHLWKMDTFPISFADGWSLVESLPDLIEEYITKKETKFDYYKPEYRKLRHEVFLRDGEICAKCGAVPRPGVSLTVDHIKPVSRYPDLVMDKDNLQILCWECNQNKSNKHSTDYRN